MQSRLPILILLVLAIAGVGCGSPYVSAMAKVGGAAIKGELGTSAPPKSNQADRVAQEPAPETPRPPRWVPAAAPAKPAEDCPILILFFRA